jgi:hypothetical protein
MARGPRLIAGSTNAPYWSSSYYCPYQKDKWAKHEISKCSDVEEHLNIRPFYTFADLKKKIRNFVSLHKPHKQTTLQYLVRPLLIFLCSPHDQQSHHGDSIEHPNKKTGKVNERRDVSSNDEY